MTDVTVQLDLYPSNALLADCGTTYHNVRTTVADGNVQVWRNEAGGPVIVYTSPLVSWAGNVRTGYDLTTADGLVVAGMNGGCGCGAQLGTADLWPGKRRINTSL